MSLPFLSWPKVLICPATCAPTSTTSSGSTVPVAPIVASRSPRWTGAVRKVVGAAALPRAYHRAPPASNSAATTVIVIFILRPIVAPSLSRLASAGGALCAVEHPLHVRSHLLEQSVQLVPFARIQAGQHRLHLRRMFLEHAPHQTASGARETHLPRT